MIKKILAVAAMSVVAFSAQAADKSTRDFGDILGECGIGAMLFPDDRTIAIITNITWDLGTTAVTSNMSSEGTCKGGQAETAKLVMQSYPELENDIASGEGEHLAALMAVANCGVGAEAELRQDFSKVVSVDGFAGQSREAKAESLYNVVVSSNACAV